ncbi:MAG: AAA family ATPase [Gammaproteobacteria bacterium]|nr:AAA family ATPase [Gammaproteobacteria bacterium]
MYLAHFGLREPPFSIAPDPAYLYLSPRHQEALGHLLYGIGIHGGFVQLTGEVGTGKTTMVRTLLREKLEQVDAAMVYNPRQNELEFLASICDELRVDCPRQPAPTLKQLIDALSAHLLAAHARGRRTVLIIDEAQNLSPAVLEQVRLLTNLETDKEKLLRIMLVGQPELAELLARPELRQLASRITARYHLLPLTAAETREYIAHRLRVAGGRADLFSPAAVRMIHRRSGGVPRLINIICDRALLGAYADGAHSVDRRCARRAAAETLTSPLSRPWWHRLHAGLPMWLEGLAAAVALLVAGMLLYRSLADSGDARPTVSVPTPVSASTPRALPEPPPAPAAAQTSPTPIADIGRILDQPEPLADLTARLIGLWTPGLQIGAGQDVCAALTTRQLACYRGQGTLNDLEQMDLPAILSLSLGRDTHQYVLLRKLGDDTATLLTADGPRQLPLAQLAPLWNGEFFLLWPDPAGSTLIAPGASGPAVVWLRRSLAIAGGQTPSQALSSVFDGTLRQQVLNFQHRHDLDADGLAGAQTLIALVTALPDFSGPRLSNAQPAPTPAPAASS